MAKITMRARQFDWWLVGAVFFLLAISLAMHYTIGLNQTTPSLDGFYKQLYFVLGGLIIFGAASLVDARYYKIWPIIYVMVAVIILAGVLFFGTTIKGTTGWFVVGPLSLQPVEIAKILLIFFMSSFLASDARQMQRPRAVIISGAVFAVIAFLIILQPDLGSALILFFIWLGYLLVLKASKWVLLAIAGAVVVGVLLGWNFWLQDYQKDRLTTFLNPASDPQGAGYNITQSIVAVGSGGWWGKGIGLGTQSQLHFLPEIASDFIFAVIAEELGFIGVIATMIALSIIFFRLWMYVKNSPDIFKSLVCLGTLGYLVFQSFFTISMNIGLLPVTGLPLPLVSAGGSSLLATLFLLGVSHNSHVSS